jgi:hypothetical protein
VDATVVMPVIALTVQASRHRGDRGLGGSRGCQQVVSNDPTRSLASHHRASSYLLAEQL